MIRKTPLWIDERDILAIHDRLLALHGGAAGLRDRGLLEAALARPRQHFSYAESTGVIEMAALYTAGIIQNHPFVDGNKRAGFTAGVLFLEVNGFKFMAPEESVIANVFALAAGDLDEAGYGAWLRSNARPKRKR